MHTEGRAYARTGLAIVLLSMLLPLLAGVVRAQGPDTASTGSCAQVTALAGVNSGREWVATTDLAMSATDDCDNAQGPMDFGAGQSLTLKCYERTFGLTPPDVATSLTITLVSDNVNFGSADPAGAFRSITPSGNTCTEAGGESITIACTDTGSAGGSARYGTVRIHIHAVRTTVVTYDQQSESGEADDFWGIYRCTPGLTALSQSNAQTMYVAGDTIGTSVTANASQYDSTTNGNFWVTCGSVSYNLGASFPASTAKSLTTTVIGSLVTNFPTTCNDLSFGYQFTRKSAVSGFTTEDYAFWGVPPTLPSGVTLSDSSRNATLSTTADLSRVRTASSCDYRLNASGSGLTTFNRMEGVSPRCPTWLDARNNALGNNVPMRGFITRSVAPDATDYTSTDFTSGAGGLSEWTKASGIAANPGSFHGEVQTFSTTARTESVLLSVGNMTSTFVLSRFHNLTNVLGAFTSGGANTTTFTIGDVQEFHRPTGLVNARGSNKGAGVPVSCVRTPPTGTPEASVSHGLTDANGDASWIEYSVISPKGTWTLVCTTESAGNTASYTVTFFHVSAFTADKAVTIEWVYDNATKVLDFGAGIHSIGTNTIDVDAFDDPNDVRYEVVARQDFGYPWYVVSSGFMVKEATNVWTKNATMPNNYTRYAHIHVWGNVTGQPFLGTVPVTLRSATLTGNFSGNFTGNVTGNFSGNVTGNFSGNLTGVSLNVTCNTTGVTCAGNFSGNFTGNFSLLDVTGMLTTAIDSYLPLLVWGGLVILFMWLGAFVPAVFAFVAFGESFLPVSLWPIEASFMLVGLSLALQLIFGMFPEFFKWAGRGEFLVKRK